MRLRSLSTFIALVLGFATFLAVVGGASAADTITVQLSPQNNSGQSGTATLTDLGDGTTRVVLNLTDIGSASQPVHIHDGTCATLNPTPKYPLTNLVNGKSETVVKVSLSQLVAQPFAINAHKSAQEVAVYTACGNIVGTVAGMPSTGGGGMARQSSPSLALGAGLLTLAAAGGAFALRRRRA